jgi:DNA-binding transcriptional MerR regulator
MTTDASMKIGALASRTGTTAPAIRYYEEIGLLPRADRQEGGQRRYGAADVRRLTFIRRCREFDFSLDDVRELLTLMGDPERDCAEARDIAQTHLAGIRKRVRELQSLERTLDGFVGTDAGSCAGGPGPDCIPLAKLAVPRADASTATPS